MLNAQMYSDLKGKRLLVLGGIRTLCDYVIRAQKMGAYVYVADYDIDSPAKKIADEAVLLNAIDVDQIVEFCEKHKIDGITTGYVDILLKPWYESCNKLGLNCYLTEELIEASTNKDYFKQICNKYNVPVAQSYNINKSKLEEEAQRLKYPVFVKPLDASGSRGAAACNTPDEFIQQYRYAETFSKGKNVIVEQLLAGTEFLMDYVVINGEPYLVSMFDRLMSDDRNTAINHSDLCIAPSAFLTRFEQEIHPQIVNMIKGMNIENGILFFQGFSNESDIILYEMGCRLGGTFQNVDEHCIGINPMDMLINYAITGNMISDKGADLLNPHFFELGGVINIMAKSSPNKISVIEGIEDVIKLPQIIHHIQRMFEGDYFIAGSITDSPVVSFYIYAKDLAEYKEVVEYVYSKIKVYDEFGDSLLMKFYDLDKLSVE